MRMWVSPSDKEYCDFVRWARSNYEPGTEIKGLWHPVVQRECVRMNEEWGEYHDEGGE